MKYRRVGSSVLAVLYALSHVVFLDASEIRFWSERRASVVRRKGETSPFSSSPFHGRARAGSSRDVSLLARLPEVGRTSLPSILPGLASSVSPVESLPKERGSLPVVDPIPSWVFRSVAPYGTVHSVHRSSKVNAPLIIHLQDAHGVVEAQKNLASMILRLRENGVSLLGLEGAEGDILTEPFRLFKNADITNRIAGSFLERGDFGGPEFAILTSTLPITTVGIETGALYDQNVAEAKNALALKSQTLTTLAQYATIVEDLKAKTYSTVLCDYDGRLASYREGKSGLSSFVRQLPAFTKQAGIRTPLPRHVQRLIQALEQESRLDFRQVETRRVDLAERLASVLSEREMGELIQRSLELKIGKIGSDTYYRYFNRVCEEHGLPLKNFAPLDAYIRYVLLAEHIDRRILMEELTALENAVMEGLAKTPKEKELVSVSRDVGLLQSLASLSMSPEDWEIYSRRRDRVLDLQKRLGLLGGVAVPTLLSLEPFEAFCSVATERNGALAGNLLKAMSQKKVQAAVLVAGGFHSEGLEKILAQQDASSVIITPKITEVPRENHSLDVFARSPIPLEKIFVGETIYLVRTPAVARPGEDVAIRYFADQAVAQGTDAALVNRGAERLLMPFSVAPCDSSVPGRKKQDQTIVGQTYFTEADVTEGGRWKINRHPVRGNWRARLKRVWRQVAGRFSPEEESPLPPITVETPPLREGFSDELGVTLPDLRSIVRGRRLLLEREGRQTGVRLSRPLDEHERDRVTTLIKRYRTHIQAYPAQHGGEPERMELLRIIDFMSNNLNAITLLEDHPDVLVHVGDGRIFINERLFQSTEKFPFLFLAFAQSLSRNGFVGGHSIRGLSKTERKGLSRSGISETQWGLMDCLCGDRWNQVQEFMENALALNRARPQKEWSHFDYFYLPTFERKQSRVWTDEQATELTGRLRSEAVAVGGNVFSEPGLLSDDTQDRLLTWIGRQENLQGRPIYIGRIPLDKGWWQTDRYTETVVEGGALFIGVNDYLLYTSDAPELNDLFVANALTSLTSEEAVTDDKDDIAQLKTLLVDLGESETTLEDLLQDKWRAQERIYGFRKESLAPVLSKILAERGGTSDGFGQDAFLYSDVRVILDRLLLAAGFTPSDFDLLLLDQRDANAFNVLNAHQVVLHRGLLENFLRVSGNDLSFSHDVLAAVLAHELGHVAQGCRAVLEGTLDMSRDPMAHSAHQYSGMEKDADVNWMLDLMDRAGFDVNQAPLVFRLLKRAGNSPSYFDVHPTDNTRIRELEMEITRRTWRNRRARRSRGEPFSSEVLNQIRRVPEERSTLLESAEVATLDPSVAPDFRLDDIRKIEFEDFSPLEKRIVDFFHKGIRNKRYLPISVWVYRRLLRWHLRRRIPLNWGIIDSKRRSLLDVISEEFTRQWLGEEVEVANPMLSGPQRYDHERETCRLRIVEWLNGLLSKAPNRTEVRDQLQGTYSQILIQRGNPYALVDRARDPKEIQAAVHRAISTSYSALINKFQEQMFATCKDEVERISSRHMGFSSRWDYAFELMVKHGDGPFSKNLMSSMASSGSQAPDLSAELEAIDRFVESEMRPQIDSFRENVQSILAYALDRSKQDPSFAGYDPDLVQANLYHDSFVTKFWLGLSDADHSEYMKTTRSDAVLSDLEDSFPQWGNEKGLKIASSKSGAVHILSRGGMTIDELFAEYREGLTYCLQMGERDNSYFEAFIKTLATKAGSMNEGHKSQLLEILRDRQRMGWHNSYFQLMLIFNPNDSPALLRNLEMILKKEGLYFITTELAKEMKSLEHALQRMEELIHYSIHDFLLTGSSALQILLNEIPGQPQSPGSYFENRVEILTLLLTRHKKYMNRMRQTHPMEVDAASDSLFDFIGGKGDLSVGENFLRMNPHLFQTEEAIHFLMAFCKFQESEIGDWEKFKKVDESSEDTLGKRTLKRVLKSSGVGRIEKYNLAFRFNHFFDHSDLLLEGNPSITIEGRELVVSEKGTEILRADNRNPYVQVLVALLREPGTSPDRREFRYLDVRSKSVDKVLFKLILSLEEPTLWAVPPVGSLAREAFVIPLFRFPGEADAMARSVEARVVPILSREAVHLNSRLPRALQAALVVLESGGVPPLEKVLEAVRAGFQTNALSPADYRVFVKLVKSLMERQGFRETQIRREDETIPRDKTELMSQIGRKKSPRTQGEYLSSLSILSAFASLAESNDESELKRGQQGLAWTLEFMTQTDNVDESFPSRTPFLGECIPPNVGDIAEGMKKRVPFAPDGLNQTRFNGLNTQAEENLVAHMDLLFSETESFEEIVARLTNENSDTWMSPGVIRNYVLWRAFVVRVLMPRLSQRGQALFLDRPLSLPLEEWRALLHRMTESDFQSCVTASERLASHLVHDSRIETLNACVIGFAGLGRQIYWQNEQKIFETRGFKGRLDSLNDLWDLYQLWQFFRAGRHLRDRIMGHGDASNALVIYRKELERFHQGWVNTGGDRMSAWRLTDKAEESETGRWGAKRFIEWLLSLPEYTQLMETYPDFVPKNNVAHIKWAFYDEVLGGDMNELLRQLGPMQKAHCVLDPFLSKTSHAIQESLRTARFRFDLLFLQWLIWQELPGGWSLWRKTRFMVRCLVTQMWDALHNQWGAHHYQYGAEENRRTSILYFQFGNVSSDLTHLLSEINQGHLQKTLRDAPTVSEKIRALDVFLRDKSRHRDQFLRPILDDVTRRAGESGSDLTSLQSDLMLLAGQFSSDLFIDQARLAALELESRIHPGLFKNINDELAVLQHFFPEFSLTRDDLLLNVMERVETEADALAVRALMLSDRKNLRQEEVGKKTALLDKVFELFEGRPAKEKALFVLWVLGFLEQKPISLMEWEFGLKVNFDPLREMFMTSSGEAARYKNMGRHIKLELIHNLFEGEEGILENSDAKAFFLDRLFNGLVSQREKNRRTLRKRFDAVFAHAPREIEKNILQALIVDRSEGGQGPYQAYRLFLDACDAIGRKVGQILAYSNLVGDPDLRTELRKLGGSATTENRGIMMEEIHNAYQGRLPIKRIVRRLGSASIKVVYLVELNDGRFATLKIKRPSADHRVELQLEALDGILEDIGGEALTLRNPVRESLRQELDLKAEAENQKRMKSVYSVGGRSTVTLDGVTYTFGVADVYDDGMEVDQNQMMLEEFLEGYQPLPTAEGAPPGLNDVVLSQLLRQMFVEGFFHADPHGDNVFVKINPVNKHVDIRFIDWGSVGTVAPNQRKMVFRWLMRTILSQRVRGLKAPEIPLDNVLISMFFAKIGYLYENIDNTRLASLLKDILIQSGMAKGTELPTPWFLRPFKGLIEKRLGSDAWFLIALYFQRDDASLVLSRPSEGSPIGMPGQVLPRIPPRSLASRILRRAVADSRPVGFDLVWDPSHTDNLDELRRLVENMGSLRGVQKSEEAQADWGIPLSPSTVQEWDDLAEALDSIVPRGTPPSGPQAGRSLANLANYTAWDIRHTEGESERGINRMGSYYRCVGLFHALGRSLLHVLGESEELGTPGSRPAVFQNRDLVFLSNLPVALGWIGAKDPSANQLLSQGAAAYNDIRDQARRIHLEDRLDSFRKSLREGQDIVVNVSELFQREGERNSLNRGRILESLRDLRKACELDPESTSVIGLTVSDRTVTESRIADLAVQDKEVWDVIEDLRWGHGVDLLLANHRPNILVNGKLSGWQVARALRLRSAPLVYTLNPDDWTDVAGVVMRILMGAGLVRDAVSRKVRDTGNHLRIARDA